MCLLKQLFQFISYKNNIRHQMGNNYLVSDLNTTEEKQDKEI